MVNKKSLDRIFHALADGTRREILREVAKGSPTVGELGRPFQMSAPAISKHLKVLEGAGLVTRVKEGRSHRFRLNPDPLEEAAEFAKQLGSVWTERLEGFGVAGETVKAVERPEPAEEEVLADYLL